MNCVDMGLYETYTKNSNIAQQQQQKWKKSVKQ